MDDRYAPLSLEERAGGAAASLDEDRPEPAPPGSEDPFAAAARLMRGQRYSVWLYNVADSRPVLVVCRVDAPEGKRFVQITWRRGKGWAFGGMGEGRPLYRLPELAADPGAPVVAVEGEKAADAAARIFPRSIATTSAGGANAARKADWSALAGRRVTLWPDFDEPGARYANDVCAALASFGCEIDLVDAATLAARLGVIGEAAVGFDAADAAELGRDLEALRKIVLECASPVRPAIAVPAAAPRASAAEPAPWPAPIPIVSSLPPVLPFEADLLPEALRDYVFDVADRQQSPPDFVAVTALCGLAALIGNRIRIAPKQHDDWEVVPNLWGAIIGRPSAMKTPAMRSALAPLYKLQDELRERWQAELKDAEIDDALAGLGAKEAKKRAEKAMKSGDRDGARDILAEIAKSDGEEPPCPRLVVNDATVEKLGELLNENPRGLLLVRDELPGFLARMEREEYQAERAFYLEAFNGDGRFTYDRIGRGTVAIENCTLSIIGGVQPARIAPIVRGAISGFSNDGLIQRLQLAVWPDDAASWTWVDRHPSRAARDAYDKVFADLHALQLGSPERPTVLRFSAAAQDLYQAWMAEIHGEARSGKLSPTLESHLLKMPKTVASLALLFELVEGGRFEVGEAATARALDWADYLRSHAARLYSAGDTMAEDGAKLILERRAQLPKQFTMRDVQRKAWACLGDRDAVVAAFDVLVAAHCCREVPPEIGPMGGRPSVTYVWNPALEGED